MTRLIAYIRVQRVGILLAIFPDRLRRLFQDTQ